MDPQVKAVFINVFGGILRCDVFAQGVVQAVKNVQVQLPVVVRMEGTNVEKGRELLQQSGLNFIVADGMRDGAEKVVNGTAPPWGGVSMSILVDAQTRLLVQGITGREGTFHTEQAIAYGTQVVAGVVPGQGGTTHLGLPVFNTVEQAVRATDANASVIYVPARFATDAILEAIDAGLSLIACITEGFPSPICSS